jgi:tight adherence protein C
MVLILRAPDLLGSFLAAIWVLLGLTGPRIWLELRIERRRSQVNLVLPDLLDRLSQGLNAGLSFESAFSRTANSFSDSFGVELRKVVREWQFGHTRSNALRSLVDRYPADSLAAFIAAVNQADELGTSLSETLRTQSKLLRSQRRRRAHEASRRLPILIAFPLVLFFLPALLIIYLVPPLLTLFFGH